MTSELIQHATHLAESTKQEFSIAYDLNGIKTIEEKINDNRAFYEGLEEKEKRHLSYKIGAFIGMCMVKNYKGAWEESEHGLGIKIKNHLAFPIQKVFKFLNEDGIFESISSFYEISGSLDEILENSASNSEADNTNSHKPRDPTRPKKWWEFWKTT